MKSVSGKNWEEIKINKRLVEKAKVDHNLDFIQAKLIISRYFSETEIFSIKNKIAFQNPFSRNNDFLQACELFKKHIHNKSKILIIGDYDVDGCVSTSLIVNFLKKIDIKSDYYIPHRIKDGYGASKSLVNKLIKDKKPELIIFLDCGSNSNEALEYINTKNIESLVIDHHNTKKPYPISNVFINPKKSTEYQNYDYLCSAFLTYFFLDLYIKLNRLKISINDQKIYTLLATVADVMPIRGLNRLLAINTIKNFDINKNIIFNNLFALFKLKKKIELEDLGFRVAPVINSAGRLEDANKIVELFTTDSNKRLNEILKKVFNLNLKRKLVEKKCLDELNFNDIKNHKGVIFIYKNDIPEGIIGIIASKIKEYFGRPCIVFTNSGKIIKGSARSTQGFNIANFINKALEKKILINGGGHNLAAGVSLFKSKINLFKNFLDKFYLNNYPNSQNEFISKISLNSINKIFFDNLNLLGPFGNGNESPVFLIENVKIVKASIRNDKFISCFIKSNNKMINAISFNHINSAISYEIINSKNNLNILIKIKENKWNNKSSLQLEIIDVIKCSNNA